MTTTHEPTCYHRSGDCRPVLPGVQQCVCGQLFVFVARGGCGRYKRAEELTAEDRRDFSPEVEAEYLAFVGRARAP